MKKDLIMKENNEKIRVQSLNFIEEKKKKLKEIFPEIFSDGNLDILKLKELCNNSNEENEINNEFYGLFWPGKKKAKENSRSQTQGTLSLLKDCGVDIENTKNIFIEGENLEVLKLLQKSYANKIKLIYIDPPYNTGNDFIYHDKYSEGKNDYYKKTKQADENGQLLTSNPIASGRFHSNWLSMMYPRLELARNLLCEDGVIFISIDDNEIHNLRHLMDEIFGQGNFCGVIKRRASRKSTFLSKTMSDLCDYLVIYSKGELSEILSVEQVSDGTRPVFNEGNKLTNRTLYKGIQAKCDDGVYKAGEYSVRSFKFELLNELIIKNGILQNDVEVNAPWRVNQQIINKSIFITKHFGFRRKVLDEELEKKKVLSDLLDNSDCYNEKGSEELYSLFENEKCVFDNPKPIGLMQYIFKACNLKENDYVLDFFAGSGTTLHSVLYENSIKDFSINCISIQIPLKIKGINSKYETISELTIERINKAIKKITSHSEFSKTKNSDLGFKCFSLKETNFKNFDNKNVESLSELENLFSNYQETLKSNRIEEDIIWEIILQEGFPLHSKIKKEMKIINNIFYRISSNWCFHELLICFDDKINYETEFELLNLEKSDIDNRFILILKDKALYKRDDIKIRLSDKFKIKTL
ncbi:site-specific DNA-methyltransferase [Silvanigrella paludirubra]|uniref:site-specific DNA-methyltransferase (adenine-specific) n=2 Tax=Silvanigrella paludirubra TaxID=2499159 RepID=A0A6N6VXQ8_9BACT|nr:site-specific DNA-methyltransferase [Silvanigrella paludirubra]